MLIQRALGIFTQIGLVASLILGVWTCFQLARFADSQGELRTPVVRSSLITAHRPAAVASDVP